MKKHLLFACIAIAAAPAVMAQEANPDDATHSTNLTLEWYGVPTGCTDAGTSRSGIGVNGKFYVATHSKGISIFNKDGKIKEIDNNRTWVSINCDDAGHVYFRNDNVAWPGPEGQGWYESEYARFCVLDSKTDDYVKKDIPLSGGVKSRFDALSHVMGDLVNSEFAEIITVNNGTGGIGYEFMFDKLETIDGSPISFQVNNVIKEGGIPAPANVVLTLSMGQQFNGGDNLAVLTTNHVEVTGSAFGWGNNIALYEYDEEIGGYKWAEKWFNTPNHSAISGMMVFEYDGETYIVYPTGTTVEGYPAGDGFFVMKAEYVDTPANKKQSEDPELWSAELHKAVAYKYATEGITSGNNYRGINVEPIEGQDGKFRIYFFDPCKSMQVWQLDLTGSAGIEDLVADTKEAKIYGGVGVVVTDGAETAQVYTPAGLLVAQGKGEIAVAPGLYIVKAGNAAAKVIVK